MKWGAVTTAKAAGGYVINEAVNNAGDEVTGRGRLLAEASGEFCIDSRVENGETMCPTCMVPTLDLSSGNMACCPSHLADKYMAQLFLDLVDSEMGGQVEAKVGAESGETAVGPAWFAFALPLMKWGAVTTAKAAGGYVINEAVNDAGDEVTGRGRRLVEGIDMTCLAAKTVKGELQCPVVFVATMDISRKQMMCCPADVAERYTAQLLRDQMEYEDTLDAMIRPEAAVGAEETAVGPFWMALALPAAKWAGVTTAKAVGTYAITYGVNEAGDQVTGGGRLLAEVDDMWCYATMVENGQTMCPTCMVPTLDLSSGNLVCCPPHVADKYTIQLLNSLEGELDAEEGVGIGIDLRNHHLMNYRSSHPSLMGYQNGRGSWFNSAEEKVGTGIDLRSHPHPSLMGYKNGRGNWLTSKESKVGNWQTSRGHLDSRSDSDDKPSDSNEDTIGEAKESKVGTSELWQTRNYGALNSGSDSDDKPSDSNEDTIGEAKESKVGATGELWQTSGGFDSGSDSDDKPSDSNEDTIGEESQVSGPSRYDPTGRRARQESQVSGPARVDHWDDPMSMKASANSAFEGQTMYKVVQPMIFILAAIGAFTTFNAAAKCLRKTDYTQIHEPEI